MTKDKNTLTRVLDYTMGVDEGASEEEQSKQRKDVLISAAIVGPVFVILEAVTRGS